MRHDKASEPAGKEAWELTGLRSVREKPSVVGVKEGTRARAEVVEGRSIQRA